MQGGEGILAYEEEPNGNRRKKGCKDALVFNWFDCIWEVCFEKAVGSHAGILA
jgi:hypothetical protein